MSTTLIEYVRGQGEMKHDKQESGGYWISGQAWNDKLFHESYTYMNCLSTLLHMISRDGAL